MCLYGRQNSLPAWFSLFLFLPFCRLFLRGINNFRVLSLVIFLLQNRHQLGTGTSNQIQFGIHQTLIVFNLFFFISFIVFNFGVNLNLGFFDLVLCRDSGSFVIFWNVRIGTDGFVLLLFEEWCQLDWGQATFWFFGTDFGAFGVTALENRN